MLVELRYNWNHKNGDKPWKVFIDNQLFKVDSVVFNCQIKSTLGQTVDGKPTGHVSCDARKITFENNLLTID